MPKMNPELKAKWVAALRDPERKQTQGVLRRGNAMCCLGVLCDVIDPEKWQSDDGLTWQYGDDSSIALPPKDCVSLIGFVPFRETLVIDGQSAEPQTHNDMYSATFLQIADAIEEQW